MHDTPVEACKKLGFMHSIMYEGDQIDTTAFQKYVLSCLKIDD